MKTVYPLRNAIKNGTRKIPMHSGNTEEYVSGVYDFWLTDEGSNRYRLHSKHEMRWNDSLAYDVVCPKCGQTLSVCGTPLNYNDLFLYECRNCGKN